jgi:hypothetical protein
MKVLYTLLFLALMLSACNVKRGSGNIITERRSHSGFTGISVTGPIEVELSKGNSPEIIVEGDDNLIKYIETRVEGSLLRIRLEKGLNLRNSHLKILITAPAVSRIKASAAADVRVKDELSSTGEINIEASSGARIRSSIDAPAVVAKASSGSEVRLSGRTRNVNASSSSGASIHAYDLLSEGTIAKSSSGASVSVHASIRLEASASSGGEVDYHGAPQVKQHISSGGSVKRTDQ